MLKNQKDKSLFLMLFFIISVILFLKFVSADTANCYLYNEMQGGNKTACNNAGCLWASNDSSDATNNIVDLWCSSGQHCCLADGCWFYAGHQSKCTNTTDSLNCTWDPYSVHTYPNGTTFYGACSNDYSSGSNMSWGGVSQGCWNYNADYESCTSGSNAQKCTWKANNANQNPSCWIKSLTDAQAENSAATSTDIGCCEQTGCWTYHGNQTKCQQNTAFMGICAWTAKAADPYCSDDIGCCYTKMCNEVADQVNCTKMATDLFMPCEWSGGACKSYGGGVGGGFSFYNDTDSCMSKGGWYDMSGACQMPSGTFENGTGGFMFAEQAHCWFADQQPEICRNITGCIYCNDTGTHFNITGNSGTSNKSSACYGHMVGICQGHESAWVTSAGITVYDIATDALKCVNIQIKGACMYGPLPNCVWNSTSNLIGPYCAPGTSSIQKGAPPVPYCEHPNAISNYSLCMELAQEYLMPCKWGNASSNKTLADNCTFNSNAVFGSAASNTEKEFEVISSEYSCTAAGGTWKTEYYVESNILKQESWCEKGAMYDWSTGTALGNKGNCNTDCWACEFYPNGSSYTTSALASAACTGSALGFCVFTSDTNAPNTFGYCNYPNEMTYGAGNCQTNCKDCSLMAAPYFACVTSAAGCKWVNNTDNSNAAKLSTGSCVENSKKICDEDCFSCYDFYSCNISTTHCQWDSISSLCKPIGYTGEVCFNGLDDDGDNMKDCGDPDCSYNTACGGSSIAGCASYITPTNCNRASAFGGKNCTWMNSSWETFGHCGMPGENCWEYVNNLTLCGTISGCTNSSTSGGGNYCMVNTTKETSAKCHTYLDSTTCSNAANCTWKTPDFGQGYCMFWIHAKCNNHTTLASCNADGNCTWDTYSNTFCNVACHNETMTSEDKCISVPGGVCEWRTSTNTCMPETFASVGMGTGAMTGCAQYNGNYSSCLLNNYSCSWHNDTSVNNNVSWTEPDGWCDTKGQYAMSGEIKGDIINLGSDASWDISIPSIDIDNFGMRNTPESYGFGIHVRNITGSALCNGFPVKEGGTGGGINTTKFYWYLDTDGDSSANDHCTAVTESSTTYHNFEFYIKYVVENTTIGIGTEKQLYMCVQNTTSGWQWVATNIFISDNKRFSCFESGAAFVTVERTGMEAFDTFNITTPMRILGMSSDGSTIDDSVGPGYYTPGTIDFEFIDCSNPNIKDIKCKNFKKFGFQMFEDCKNSIDDDGDGFADCNDPKCGFSPACASGTAFNFVYNSNDKKAPVATFNSVDKMASEAIVMYDTDEPANGTLVFYNQSSTCTLGPGNMTINDLGDPASTYDDYKPFHRALLDFYTLGYLLTNSTTYYYKVKTCDPSGNCGTSKCLNFTTKKEDKNFIFRMDIPEGYTVDIPALNYSGNFTTTVANKTYDIGIKTNSSQTKGMNITVNYSDYSIMFVGADVYKPKTLSMENAFIISASSGALGMNSTSKSWNMLLNDLGLGGSNDYVDLEFPVAYSSSNSINWNDDSLSSTTDVSAYTTCSGDSSSTHCKIPTSLGFTVYRVSSASSSGASGGDLGYKASSVTTNESVKDEEAEEQEKQGEDAGEAGTAGEGAEGTGARAGTGTAWKTIIGVVLVLIVLYGLYNFFSKKRK